MGSISSFEWHIDMAVLGEAFLFLYISFSISRINAAHDLDGAMIVTFLDGI